MLYKILLLSFLLCSTSWATVPVERFPSGTPVQVCVPSDSNSNCGGTTSLTVGTTTIANGTNGYVEYNNNGVLGEKAGGGGAVSSVSNTDGYLTSSPTTGAVVVGVQTKTQAAINITTMDNCGGVM